MQGDARSAVLLARESHLAAMFLDNLGHDRETKARPFLAGRHIRFDDPLPILRQADAIVPNLYPDEIPLAGEVHRYAPAIIGSGGRGPASTCRRTMRRA